MIYTIYNDISKTCKVIKFLIGSLSRKNFSPMNFSQGKFEKATPANWFYSKLPLNFLLSGFSFLDFAK